MFFIRDIAVQKIMAIGRFSPEHRETYPKIEAFPGFFGLKIEVSNMRLLVKYQI